MFFRLLTRERRDRTAPTDEPQATPAE
jgi:hypothetical protein